MRLLLVVILGMLSGWALPAQTAAGDNDAKVQELYAEAKAAQAKGDIAGAIAGYREILHIAPKLAAAYNNLGALYFRQRDFKSAVEVLEQGLKVNSAMPSATALLGLALYEMADYAKAKARLEATVKANPADTNAQLFLAKDLNKLGDYEASAVQLQQIAARQPQNQEVWYLLAKTHMKLSEQAFAKMNAIDPHSPLSHELSAEVMESMNNYDGAVVELKKAEEMAPQRAGTHLKLGEAYLALGQWDPAIEQFRGEMALDPGNCVAQWKTGAAQLQKNSSPEEALAGINQALERCPALTDARVDRARALLKLNRNDEAVTDLEAVTKADPNEPGNHFLLAKAYRSVGRTREAQAEMQLFSKLEESTRAATAERAQEVIKNKQPAR